MKLLAVLVCAATLAIAWPALAEVTPEKTGPTWLERKVHELRHERDWLRAERRELRRQVRQLRRASAHRPSSLEAIRLAAIATGAPLGEMLAVAHCETGGTFDPRAKNPTSTASGLFQFLYPSTWRRTPYRDESVWSPYANALAAGWLWRANGGSWREWVCKPR